MAPDDALIEAAQVSGPLPSTISDCHDRTFGAMRG